MTSQEASAKTQDKVHAIKTLCAQLQVEVTGEQVMDSRGFIKNIVFYTDTEKYDIEDPKPNEEPKPVENEAPKPEPEEIKNPGDLRE